MQTARLGGDWESIQNTLWTLCGGPCGSGGSGGSSLWTVSGNDMYNTNSGKVSVGTASPSSDTKLTIQEDAGNPCQGSINPPCYTVGLRVRYPGYLGILLGQTPPTYSGAPSAGVLNLQDNKDLLIATNNLERMRITATGNVGIRTANPAPNAFVDIANNPTGYSLMAPTIYASNYIYAASYYLATGSCLAGACASDERVKDHIRPFTPGLDALLAINPVYYRYNGLGGTIKMDTDGIGVLAQDVNKGAPELVTSETAKLNSIDETRMEIEKVNYTALQYMLINAVKELYSRWSGDSQKLHAIIDALQNENDELKIRVEKLEARVGN